MHMCQHFRYGRCAVPCCDKCFFLSSWCACAIAATLEAYVIDFCSVLSHERWPAGTRQPGRSRVSSAGRGRCAVPCCGNCCFCGCSVLCRAVTSVVFVVGLWGAHRVQPTDTGQLGCPRVTALQVGPLCYAVACCDRDRKRASSCCACFLL